MSAVVARAAADDDVDGWPVAPPRDAPVSLVPAPSDHAHFVFKKGHLGRYRFNLMVDEGRVGGDVRVATAGVARIEKERAALLQMKRVAEALLGSLNEALIHLDQASLPETDPSGERS
jgi:hypothetical protein